MKARREHRVPLSSGALAVLEAVRPLRKAADGWIFPGRRKGIPLSNMAMNMLSRRMKRADLRARSLEVDSTSSVNRPLKHRMREHDWFNLKQSCLSYDFPQVFEEYGSPSAGRRPPMVKGDGS